MHFMFKAVKLMFTDVELMFKDVELMFTGVEHNFPNVLVTFSFMCYPSDNISLLLHPNGKEVVVNIILVTLTCNKIFFHQSSDG